MPAHCRGCDTEAPCVSVHGLHDAGWRSIPKGWLCPACCRFPADEGEHSAADAPPSAIDAALARLAPNVRHALARHAAATAPALPLELAAADALEEAESSLLDVRDGTASYTDLTVALASIVALLRGGLGDDHDG